MAQTYKQLSKERKKLQEKGDLPEWYSTSSWQMFKGKYAVKGEAAVRGRFETIARTLAKHTNAPKIWEAKFFNVLWKGWLSPSTPILSNCGTNRGLTVACSGSVVGDSIDSFYSGLHEQAILSKYGFGCSAYFGNIRPRGAPISTGGEASGVVTVMEDYFTMASKVSQGSSRRGSTACYLDIDHGDFDELLDHTEMNPDGVNIGWNVTDAFIERLKSNDPEAQRRFKRALYTKLVTGKGYFFFVDKVNRARPQMYKDLGLRVWASNLCSEITLYSDDGPLGTFESDTDGGHTFTCVLSSMNVFKWDEWKDTDAVFIATVFLDCVVSDFLEKSYGINGLQKAHRFTRKGRPIGLGMLGFSTYLQSKMIPYESLDAYYLNDDISKKIHDDSLEASQWMASQFGEPEWCKGYGVRNSHRVAYAPTKSTANLMGGLGESFSPDPAMVWTQGSSVGELPRIAPEFLKVLKAKGLYNDDMINRIIQNLGSIQGLPEFTDHEKLVFKTAFEVDQNTLIKYAAVRQRHTDQGQSVNIYVGAEGDEKRIAKVTSDAFLNENVHSLYYIYSMHGVTVSDTCVACEA